MSDQNDLQVEGVLTTGFYTNRPPGAAAAAAAAAVKPEPARRNQKPTHYKVICISLYNDDLRRLDAMVDSLKARGMTKANRSALIRYALGEVDLESVPRGL